MSAVGNVSSAVVDGDSAQSEAARAVNAEDLNRRVEYFDIGDG